MKEIDIQFSVCHESDPENSFYKDAINELKKGHTVYVYREPILKKILETFPNIKVTKQEFYWKLENKVLI